MTIVATMLKQTGTHLKIIVVLIGLLLGKLLRISWHLEFPRVYSLFS